MRQPEHPNVLATGDVALARTDKDHYAPHEVFAEALRGALAT